MYSLRDSILNSFMSISNSNYRSYIFSIGFGGNISYTFHLHGYNVSVIGRDSFGRPITKDEIISLDRDNKIVRYLVNPIQKDTFVVPNKGYIILRLFTDNLGERLYRNCLIPALCFSMLMIEIYFKIKYLL